jgi:orotate phosphoribosyltransferase
MTSALRGHPIPAFIVRKAPKGHGTGAWLEGAKRLAPGSELVVLEDVVTTGGSALSAARRVREAGFEVRLVLGLVDRLEGGRAAIEAEGLRLETLFTRRDFLSDDEVEP